MMLTALLGAAVRGGPLLALVWVLLKTLRLRNPAIEKNTWTLVVAAALVMPLLAWVAGVVTPPLRMVPLRMIPSGTVASTQALTGTASGLPGSGIDLVCAFVYAAVTAVLLARFATGLWIGTRLRRCASIVSGPGLDVASIDVRVSAVIRSPASFASTILLPSTYETWDKATLATVLAHEQAHVRNRDCYRLWLAALYRAVFWFDPLAYWLHWRLRDLSELTSDEAAAAAVGDRAAYAAILKRMASPPQFIQSTVAMADAASLGRRLRRLSKEQSAYASLARPCKALLMSAVLVVVVLAAVPWAGAIVPVEQHPATLEFHLVDELNNPVQAQQSGEVPSGDQLYRWRDGTPILVKRDVVATGDEVTHVTAITTRDGPMVDVRLDVRGAASMLSVTRENVGHRMATVYNGVVVNVAVIRGVFGQSFQVSGLTTAEARALATQFDRASK
jgi:beta-lactamase regulating signal transducer with metallopeptidase domain